MNNYELGRDRGLVHVDDDGEYLEHFGVKGMHWGVRRADVHPGSVDRRKADKALEKQKTKGTQALTNKELGDLNKRLQLEKSLKDLQKNPAKLTIKKGNAHVKEILAAGATLAAVLTFHESDAGKALLKRFGLARPPGAHYG